MNLYKSSLSEMNLRREGIKANLKSRKSLPISFLFAGQAIDTEAKFGSVDVQEMLIGNFSALHAGISIFKQLYILCLAYILIGVNNVRSRLLVSRTRK